MPENVKISQEGHLEIGGVDALDLASQHQTPLIAYDVSEIKQQISAFRAAFEKSGLKYRIVYASKAFSSLAMYRLLAAEKLGCDVVSGGELYAALRGGMDPQMIEFHGNNKLPAELEYAVDQNIGCIVVDNFYEIDLLEKILATKKAKIRVAIRVAPGVEAQTHKYISTGQSNSKFGFDLKSGQAQKALERLLNSDLFDVVGLHCHIGSQIFGVQGFRMAAVKMIQLIKEWHERFDFVPQILNLGGGFGIQYTAQDHPLAPGEFIENISQTIKEESAKAGLAIPEIWVEPGRSLVGEAGTTLYTVGSTKKVPGLCNFIAVDGGMGDNIRPALYGAKYTALLARDPNARETQKGSVVGKYCESGDVLISDQLLPTLHAGDVLATPATGAYGYSMASTYNRNGRPAVVFCEDGDSQLVIRRETYEDMLRYEL